jgi:hypothetical protein
MIFSLIVFPPYSDYLYFITDARRLQRGLTEIDSEASPFSVYFAD